MPCERESLRVRGVVLRDRSKARVEHEAVLEEGPDVIDAYGVPALGSDRWSGKPRDHVSVIHAQNRDDEDEHANEGPQRADPFLIAGEGSGHDDFGLT